MRAANNKTLALDSVEWHTLWPAELHVIFGIAYQEHNEVWSSPNGLLSHPLSSRSLCKLLCIFKRKKTDMKGFDKINHYHNTSASTVHKQPSSTVYLNWSTSKGPSLITSVLGGCELSCPKLYSAWTPCAVNSIATVCKCKKASSYTDKCSLWTCQMRSFTWLQQQFSQFTNLVLNSLVHSTNIRGW